MKFKNVSFLTVSTRACLPQYQRVCGSRAVWTQFANDCGIDPKQFDLAAGAFTEGANND
jgi:hypothetical protein